VKQTDLYFLSFLTETGSSYFHRDHYSGSYIYIYIILGTTVKGILAKRHVTTRLLRILTKPKQLASSRSSLISTYGIRFLTRKQIVIFTFICITTEKQLSRCVSNIYIYIYIYI